MQDPLSDKKKIKIAITSIKSQGITNIGEKGRSIENLFNLSRIFPCLLDQEQERLNTIELRRLNLANEEKKALKTMEKKNGKKKKREDKEVIKDDDEDSDSNIEHIKKKRKKKAYKKKNNFEKNMRKRETSAIVANLESYSSKKLDGVETPDIWVADKDYINSQKKVKDTKKTKKDSEENNRGPLHLQEYFYVDTSKPPENSQTFQTTVEQYNRDLQQVADPNDALQNAIHSTMYNIKDLAFVVGKITGYSHSHSWLTQEDISKKMDDEFEIVDRSKDDMFLHTPFPGQSQCINDDECAAVEIIGKPLCEFLTTQEIISRCAPDTHNRRRPCVLCRRIAINFIYINCKAECSMLPSNISISNYGNRVDAEGQYILEQCVITDARRLRAIMIPVPVHVALYYQPEVRDGITYLLQTGYHTPEQIEEITKQNF